MTEADEGMYTVSSGMTQIPVKWTAPEALNFGTYTSASDVWSFGILVWEAFSGGKTPYPGKNNQTTREQVCGKSRRRDGESSSNHDTCVSPKVERGYRMEAPEGCPPSVHQVAMDCWAYAPEERPTFSGVLERLQAILATLQQDTVV